VLGGLDLLVFTGGIGEHAAPIRERICRDFAFAGIEIDPEKNAAHATVISCDDSPARVMVLPADEERMIARDTIQLIQREEIA
jgi:acetate kinase